MSTLKVTTYQNANIDREEATDFPLHTETFSTQSPHLEESIREYLVEESVVEEDEVELYMSTLTIGADNSYYKEEDQVLIGYSFS